MSTGLAHARETALITRRIVSAANGALRAVRRVLPEPRKVCVIPPSGAGSLGDQAMMEVVRRVLSARFGLTASFLYEPRAIAAALGEDCRHVVLSSSKARFAQMAMAALGSSHVVYLATDTLDGSYSPHIVNAWLGFVEHAGRAGAKIGVLNFSFSEHPDPGVRDRLRAMSGAYFSVRDEVSLARFAQSTGQTAVLGADIAFLLEPGITSPNAARAADWARDQRRQGRIVVGVNAGGPTIEQMRGKGVSAYVEVLRRWLAADTARAVLLTPHDFRPSPIGDVEAMDAIASALRDGCDDRVEVLSPPFSAWDVKGLCANLDGVLTGRMHLAIAALGMGTPPLSVAYRGKFEGLMRHLGLDGGLIAPEAFLDCGHTVTALEAFTRDLPNRRAQIIPRLPGMRALAQRQFDWFGEV
jgi:polysaccharide pyruvyl transferase WcaK-like protein